MCPWESFFPYYVYWKTGLILNLFTVKYESRVLQFKKRGGGCFHYTCFCICVLAFLLIQKEIHTEKYATGKMHPLSFALYGAGITGTYQSRLRQHSAPLANSREQENKTGRFYNITVGSAVSFIFPRTECIIETRILNSVHFFFFFFRE